MEPSLENRIEHLRLENEASQYEIHELKENETVKVSKYLGMALGAWMGYSYGHFVTSELISSHQEFKDIVQTFDLSLKLVYAGALGAVCGLIGKGVGKVSTRNPYKYILREPFQTKLKVYRDAFK